MNQIFVYSYFSVTWCCSEFVFCEWLNMFSVYYSSDCYSECSSLKLMNVKSRRAFRCQLKSTTLWGPLSGIIKNAQLENMISIKKMSVALHIYSLAMLFPLPHPDDLFEFWLLIMFLFTRSRHYHFSLLFPLRHCSLIWCIAALDKAARVILFTDHTAHSPNCSSLICWIWLNGPLPLGAD